MLDYKTYKQRCLGDAQYYSPQEDSLLKEVALFRSLWSMRAPIAERKDVTPEETEFMQEVWRDMEQMKVENEQQRLQDRIKCFSALPKFFPGAVERFVEAGRSLAHFEGSWGNHWLARILASSEFLSIQFTCQPVIDICLVPEVTLNELIYKFIDNDYTANACRAYERHCSRGESYYDRRLLAENIEYLEFCKSQKIPPLLSKEEKLKLWEVYLQKQSRNHYQSIASDNQIVRNPNSLWDSWWDAKTKDNEKSFVAIKALNFRELVELVDLQTKQAILAFYIRKYYYGHLQSVAEYNRTAITEEEQQQINSLNAFIDSVCPPSRSRLVQDKTDLELWGSTIVAIVVGSAWFLWLYSLAR